MPPLALRQLPQRPRQDQQNRLATKDIMAPPRAYPEDSVTTDQFMAMLSAHRSGGSGPVQVLEELEDSVPEAQPAINLLAIQYRPAEPCRAPGQHRRPRQSEIDGRTHPTDDHAVKKAARILGWITALLSRWAGLDAQEVGI